MTEEEMIEWIKSADYEDLLLKWRFEPIGSVWFRGKVGESFTNRFYYLNETLDQEERVAASKEIGWGD